MDDGTLEILLQQSGDKSLDSRFLHDAIDLEFLGKICVLNADEVSIANHLLLAVE